MSDQAMGLRRLSNPKPVQVIAITGGKGGVGKTTTAVNLSISLAKQNNQVMLLDADLGLANVDVLLGLHSKRNISHVLEGECDLDDIIITGPSGLKILPASSGKNALTQLSESEHNGLIHAFSHISHDVDYLVVDTAAGISDSVLTFSKAANEIIVVLCDEPTSLTDAYALIKLLHQQHGIDKFHVVSNMVNNGKEGQQLFKKLSLVTERYLDVVLNYLGGIPFDDAIKKAIKQQTPVVELYPRSQSAVQYNTLANTIMNWNTPETCRGDLTFFIERLTTPSLT